MQFSGFVDDFMGVFTGERWRMVAEDDVESDSWSSSSLGKDSDDECKDSEAQSSFRGPLDTMDALEQVLPSKKGISKFYTGKSKSFTSLADATSVKNLSKPENPYSRKHKILIARASVFEKNHSHYPKYDEIDVSKRLANSGASAVDSGLSFTCCKNRTESKDSHSLSSSPSSDLPHLHTYGKRSTCNAPLPPKLSAPFRSLSLSDLQFAALTS